MNLIRLFHSLNEANDPEKDSFILQNIDSSKYPLIYLTKVNNRDLDQPVCEV